MVQIMDAPFFSPLRKRGRFSNPHLQDEKRTLWDLILWKKGAYADPAPVPQPPSFTYPAAPSLHDPHCPSALWIGHSTYLIQGKGWNLLTDPIWSPYCSPFPLCLFKRLEQAPFPIEQLPHLDTVLISHNHYDHLDEKSVLKLARLQPELDWIVPSGLAHWFHRRGIDRCTELSWGESKAGKTHRITAVPAQHFSGRTLWDKNKTLWNGYVIESLTDGKVAYFAGDTGYNQYDFRSIGQKWRGFDLSLLPIGSYSPRKFMEPVHCNPADAVKIHLDVHSKFSLGMHWKTFCLSEEPTDRPPYDLYLAMQAQKIPFHTFLPGEIGTRINW